MQVSSATPLRDALDQLVQQKKAKASSCCNADGSSGSSGGSEAAAAIVREATQQLAALAVTGAGAVPGLAGHHAPTSATMMGEACQQH